jgi:diguanylate cyclase (GGDEF)-like protein
MPQNKAPMLSWRPIVIITLAVMGVIVAFALGWRAIHAESETRTRLASVLDLTRHALELRYLAADLHGAQIAYGAELSRSGQADLKEGHPVKLAFLSALAGYRSRLAAMDAASLTVDEQRLHQATQRAFEQFAKSHERMITIGRQSRAQSGLASNDGSALPSFKPSAELVADLVDRITARSDRTTVLAARASDYAGIWKIVFGVAIAILAVLFGVGNARAIIERIGPIGSLDAFVRVDQLTAVADQRRFDEECPLALERARRTERNVSVAMLDLDNFDAIGDAGGHLPGNRLLAVTAASISSRLREGDMIARYGPEEFAIILHGCSADAAREIIDRVRELVPDGLTFSAGVTESDGHEEAAMTLARVKQALDAATHAGRNRTVIMRRDSTVELQRDTDLPFVMVRRG